MKQLSKRLDLGAGGWGAGAAIAVVIKVVNKHRTKYSRTTQPFLFETLGKAHGEEGGSGPGLPVVLAKE